LSTWHTATLQAHCHPTDTLQPYGHTATLQTQSAQTDVNMTTYVVCSTSSLPQTGHFVLLVWFTARDRDVNTSTVCSTGDDVGQRLHLSSPNHQYYSSESLHTVTSGNETADMLAQEWAVKLGIKQQPYVVQ